MMSPATKRSERSGARAVLFDYGGVLATVIKPEDGLRLMAAEIAAVLQRAHCPISVDDVQYDLDLANRAYEGWKRALSRTADPVEITQRQFWHLLCCDWPESAKQAVLAAASYLSKMFDLTLINRPARPDAAAVLDTLADAGIATALVCNCLSGWAAREQLASDGLDTRLGAMFFSDEFGSRKPGPAMIRAAAQSVGVDPGEAWLVGDRIDRDILAGYRAGVAATVLMQTEGGPGSRIRGVQPDHEIAELSQIPKLLGLPE